MSISVKAVGSSFAHSKSSTHGKESKHVSWVSSAPFDMVCFVDNGLMGAEKNEHAFGWLLENSLMNQGYISHVIAHLHDYQSMLSCIFTHDSHLLDLDADFFKFAPGGGSWIQGDQYFHTKHKLCSSIISNKRFMPGHIYRLDQVKNFPAYVDLYGSAFQPIAYKETALSDYYFSIVFENMATDLYFTEKVIDCFRTYTIPIYYGASKIGAFFNPRGILFYDEERDCQFVHVTPDFYYERFDAIQENYEIARHFDVTEDWIVEKYPEVFAV